MSRRCHHGSPRHLRQATRERRRGPALAERPPIAPADQPLDAPAEEPPAPPEAVTDPPAAAIAEPTAEPAAEPPAQPVAAQELEAPSPAVPSAPAVRLPQPPRSAPPVPPRAAHARPPHRPREAAAVADSGSGEAGLERGATAPQLRRFIKSRAYVPMHELRRRFAINGGDDDVIPIDVDRQRVYVGLPPREGGLLGELLRAGDIGYELSLDPIAPIVVGVYPMRPVPRS